MKIKKFAFPKTWPLFKNIYEEGHVLRNAKFSFFRPGYNFTQQGFEILFTIFLRNRNIQFQFPIVMRPLSVFWVAKHL